MSAILLIEDMSSEQCGLIQESTQDGKNLWLSGTFMQSGIKNRNGRVYPLEEMTKAVESASGIIKENGGIFGELDHPQTLSINSDRISHAITELRLENNNVYGKAKILPTPMGIIAKVLIESGIKIGVSSRGAGNVNESGLVSDFGLVTIDIVTTPSAPGAYPSSIYESLDAAKNGAKIMTLSEQVQHDVDAQKFLIKEITKWINTGLFVKR
jgi:hypothetical protein